MVVACLVAGVGAWGATVTVGPKPMYASELFGNGHAAISYPEGGTPMVVLTIPGNAADNPLTPIVEADGATTKGTDHAGVVEITVSILGGTFDGAVNELQWEADLATDADVDEDAVTMNDWVTAPGTIASILSGGRKDNSSVTIKLEAATEDGTSGTTRNFGVFQSLRFALPELKGLTGLAGANPKDPVKRVWAQATFRVVSGRFTGDPAKGEGFLTGVKPHHVEAAVLARDSLTLSISESNTKTIAMEDDADKDLTAFMSVKEKNKDGYVALATVTIATKQESTPARPASGQEVMYYVDTSNRADGDPDGDPPAPGAVYDQNQTIFKEAVGERGASFFPIRDLDGKLITEEGEGLRGAFSVSATGTRDLFNGGDLLFVDYDRDGKMGSGEQLAIDGNIATGSALSIDADRSESFDDAGIGVFTVYYMPGGKDALNHGAAINLTAMVDYSDPTAVDEAPKMSSSTLNFDGVGGPVMAYAIPHSSNGIGDKGNVRVRCEEAPAGDDEACRVFLECWDQMGNRGFGEAPMVGENMTAVWSGADIEGVANGLDEPTTRISCRVLSQGMVTVQQLTRDGNSGTLVNNTYVGEAPPAVSHSDLHAAQCGAGGADSHEC